jgi:hypothetical protein
VSDITIQTDENWHYLMQAIRGANAKVAQAIKDGLYASGLEVVRRARPKAPYKTGNLRRSITTEYQPTFEQLVGSNEKYAAIHEYGGDIPRTTAWGRKTEPYVAHYREHAYLRRGLEESEEKIQRIFDVTIQEIMVAAD